MMKFSRENLVIQEIDNLINSGCKDKRKIFNHVADKLNIPIPIVRRIARDYRANLQNKLEILFGNFDTPTPKYTKEKN